MQAITLNAYGSPDVLELKEVARPVVKEADVLVRVYAAALNAGDLFSMRGRPWLARLSVGFPGPKDYILGWDIAGRVEANGLRCYGVCIGAAHAPARQYVHGQAQRQVPRHTERPD